MGEVAELLAFLDKHTPPELLERKVEKFNPQEIRLAAVRASFGRAKGRRKTPKYVLDTLHDAYMKPGATLINTAEKFGTTRSNLFYLFKRHGRETKHKTMQPRIVHNGIVYAFDGRNYFRQTARGKQGIYLHTVLWEERHGPVPVDHWLIFLRKDYRDFSDENIKCVPRLEYYRHVHGRNRERKKKSATPD